MIPKKEINNLISNSSDDFKQKVIKSMSSMEVILKTKQIYESVCQKCRLRIFQAAVQTRRLGAEKGSDNMAMTLNNLCPDCKIIYNKIMRG